MINIFETAWEKEPDSDTISPMKHLKNPSQFWKNVALSITSIFHTLKFKQSWLQNAVQKVLKATHFQWNIILPRASALQQH